MKQILNFFIPFFPAASPNIAAEQPNQDKEADGINKDETLLNVIRPDYECPAPPPAMEPLYDLKDDGKVRGKRLLSFFY